METVERSFAGLDGVLKVSAGWSTNAAALLVRPDAEVTQRSLQAALRKAGAGFKVVSVRKLK